MDPFGLTIVSNATSNALGFAAIRQNDEWLMFSEPQDVLSSCLSADVRPLLDQVEQATASGKYAAGFLAYEAASAFDNALITHAPLDEFPVIWFGVYDNVDVLYELPQPMVDQSRIKSWSPSLSECDYLANVEKIKKEIVSGNTYQVNYSFRQRASFTGDPYRAFVALTTHHAAPYAAFINTGQFAIASLSPELFFQMDGETITCRPMKGTAPRGKNHAEDKQLSNGLINSIKDRAENLMIVDMIRNDLGRVAESGSVHVDELFRLETYETLFQMTTDVSAQTKASLGEIFHALFPSASITGAPKVNTMKLIRDLEQEPRGIYTGSIGHIAPDRKAQFNVAIRTLTLDLKEHKATYGTGSGIIWDSQPDREYAECFTKTRVVSDSFQTFELLETMRWSPAGGFDLLESHIARLKRSASYFLFALDETEIRNQLESFAGENLDDAPYRVRLLLSKQGEVTIEAAPLIPLKNYRLAVADKPIDREEVFLYHKTTNRQLYDSLLASHQDADDVLLFNEDHEVTESCIANLVVVKEGRHFTPPIECGLLGGTYRQKLLDEGKLEECIVPLDSLMDYDEIYLINSVRGRINVTLDY